MTTEQLAKLLWDTHEKWAAEIDVDDDGAAPATWDDVKGGPDGIVYRAMAAAVFVAPAGTEEIALPTKVTRNQLADAIRESYGRWLRESGRGMMPLLAEEEARFMADHLMAERALRHIHQACHESAEKECAGLRAQLAAATGQVEALTAECLSLAHSRLEAVHAGEQAEAREAAHRPKWICEFCYARLYVDMLPPAWALVWSSAVCPDCALRVQHDGGYGIVRCGAYAEVPDPRPWSTPLPHPDSEEPAR